MKKTVQPSKRALTRRANALARDQRIKNATLAEHERLMNEAVEREQLKSVCRVILGDMRFLGNEILSSCKAVGAPEARTMASIFLELNALRALARFALRHLN